MKTISLYSRKQQALKLIAFASLKYNNIPVTLNDLIAETSRLSRIISDEFCKANFDQEYNSYALNWIKKHGEEFVKSDIWTYDIEIPDDAHELDVNVMIDKMNRKS
jgi:hypothetical protein